MLKILLSGLTGLKTLAQILTSWIVVHDNDRSASSFDNSIDLPEYIDQH